MRRHLADRREDRGPKRPQIRELDLLRSTDGRGGGPRRRGFLRSNSRSPRGPASRSTRRRWPFPATACRCRRKTTPSSSFSGCLARRPAAIDAQRAQLAKRRSVLDAVLEDARSLAAGLGAGRSHEARRVSALGPRRRTADPSGSTRGSTFPSPSLEKGQAAPFERDVSKTDPGDYWRTMFDLIVLALAHRPDAGGDVHERQ